MPVAQGSQVQRDGDGQIRGGTPVWKKLCLVKGTVQIKCPRCGKINYINTERPERR